MSRPPIVIVGAGLAGLVCAKVLVRRGVADVVLLEAAPASGGRVRTTITPEGFVLDHGFQVLLDSYPAVHRHLDLAALHPRLFESGSILVDGDRRWLLAHPLRHPRSFATTARADAFPLADKLRLAGLVADVMATPDRALLAQSERLSDVSTAGYLLMCGFTRDIIERFFRPFFGGVFLDDSLATSCALFRYYLKKFAAGRALIPAGGIGEIPRQLAERLPPGVLHLSTPVRALNVEAHRATGVTLVSGGEIPARAVVLATDERATLGLLGAASPPRPTVGTTVAYLFSDRPLLDRAMLVLPAGRGGLVRHFVQVTNVSPEAAPPGCHLVSATILDRHGLDDDALFRQVQEELGAFAPVSLEPLAIIEVPDALRRQEAGFGRTAVAPATPCANVFRAGDQTASCSINAAMESGEQAAAELVRGGFAG